MTDLNSNPIVLYVVVREALGMSIGKVAAQSCHITKKLLFRYFAVQALSCKKEIKDLHLIPDDELENAKLLTEWAEHSATVIVKGASDKEWLRLKDEFGRKFMIIKDAGKTEVAPDTETIACIWPLHRNDCPKSILSLSNLK